MCGIAGILDARGQAPAEGVALAMAETLRHRGPDRRSAWRSPDGFASLGHARLNIIDLVTGDQPMVDSSGDLGLVFNGEIYNFKALRGELESAGCSFRTSSDTEVILEGYRAWGAGVVDRLDGMFAFALWDGRNRRALLARDRAGKKPLFFREVQGQLHFGSEIKALAAAGGPSLEMDPSRIPEYLAYGYVPTPGTFYRDVRALPPGCRLLWTPDGGSREERYWQLTFGPGGGGPGEGGGGRTLGEKDAVDQLRSLLREAVARRLVADVPLGAFLSGGIDSSLVVGLMTQLMDHPVKTFSIGFADDPTYDETPFARMVADQLGTDHTEFTVGAQSVDLLDRLVAAHDQPFGDSSAIPTSIVAGLCREQVTVALTGDGGDEMFAGYPRFAGFRLAEAVPPPLTRAARGLTGLLPYSRDFRSPSRRARRFLEAAFLPPEERMLRWIGYLPAVLDQVLQPELAAHLDRDALLTSFRAPLERAAGGTALDRVLTLNFDTYLLDDLLVKADRSSMLHSLELRSPFLDTAVMEFAAHLPDRLRIRGGSLKYLLKVAFPDLLPPAIRDRPKWGFGIPLPTWLRGAWRERTASLLLDPDSRMFEWLRPEPIRDLWEEHLSGTQDHGHALWALMTLETWLRTTPG